VSAPVSNEERAAPAGMVEGHHPSVAEYISSRRIAERYDLTFASTPLFGTDCQFVDDFLPGPPAKVVDLGCGTGRHVLHLARRGYDVTAVDLSEHMLEITRSKLDAADLSRELRARTVKADICELAGLADGAFDGAICMFSTLGLLKGRELRLRALREARRVLRPGGVFVFHVHNLFRNLAHADGRRWLLRNVADAALGRSELGDRLMPRYRGEIDLYLHLFTRREAGRLLKGAGLEPVRVMPLNEARDGEETRAGASLRANGFLFAARRP